MKKLLGESQISRKGALWVLLLLLLHRHHQGLTLRSGPQLHSDWSW